MSEATMTFRLDTDLKASFAQAAAAADRTAAQLLREFMRNYVQSQKEKKEEKEYDAWFRAQVQEGLDDMVAGRYISHEEMMRLINEQNARLDQINGCSRSAA